MHDYMKALRQRFYTPPGCKALRNEWTAIHDDLHQRLDRDERKLLLRLTDIQSAIQDEASLHSFISGYRLACGVCRELMEQPPNSFEVDEEQRAEGLFQKECEIS